MRTNIGIFGNGYWSKVIQDKLLASGLDKFKIKFIANSKSDYLARLDQFDLDWVIVASSNNSHYEIVETCLHQGINVFCEKPLVSCPKDATELYRLAEVNGVTLYVDDVFMWRADVKSYLSQLLCDTNAIESRWFKAKNNKNPKRCLNDLLYHHLYLVGEIIDFSKDLSLKAAIENDQLKVEIATQVGQSFIFKYGLNHDYEEHFFGSLDLAQKSDDALFNMLNSVFAEAVDLESNKRRTLWATEILHQIKKQVMPSVGVIGAGIFGTTAAILLANEGCEVTLYEKESDILQGATAHNQLRLLRGYHYPRCENTARACKLSEPKLRSYYREAIDDTARHLYAIAREGSKTTSQGFESFMENVRLDYKKLDQSDGAFSIVKQETIAGLYEVTESSYDPNKLRALIKSKLDARATIKLSHKAQFDTLQNNHQYIIGATYAEPVVSDQNYQFEVCEKPVVRLPDKFKGISILIFDGPFICIDPLSGTPYHLLGSVEGAIHHTNIGHRAKIPKNLLPYVNKGLIQQPPESRLNSFIKVAEQFFKDFTPIRHVGSYFVVRAVLPDREHDDARPSFFRKLDNNCYELFSGKISTAPDISQKIVYDLVYAPK